LDIVFSEHILTRNCWACYWM